MLEDFTTLELDNGLKLLLKDIHTAPLISTWIWYGVGSRYESPGKTGISHWVEHMQFKGTPHFPSQVLDRTISRLGGTWNAFTHMDWTTYFETLPVNAFEIALELESDRMVNSLYNPKEVELERTVVIAEREGAENSPLFLLDEAVQLAAFDQHPYRYEVTGQKEDLYRISRDDLYQHYRTYYQPANATICISGDFDTAEMVTKVRQYFENIPAKPVPELELPQGTFLKEEKRLDISGPGETTYIQIAYPSPKADSADFFALSILDSLLTGPSGLNMFGSGAVGQKTSWMYQALVEKELAVSVHGSLQATVDPFIYSISLTLHPQRSVEVLLQASDEQIDQLQEHLISDDEILRAVKQAKALFAYGSENITNQAFWMGYASAFASYDWFRFYIDNLAAITPADVQRVAQTYLAHENRVVGIYHPTNAGEV